MQKKCNTCSLPKSLAEFGSRRDSPDGLKYACRQCERARQLARSNAVSVDIKTCFRCKETKSSASFYKNRRYADGLNGACKACDNIKMQLSGHRTTLKRRYSLAKLSAARREIDWGISFDDFCNIASEQCSYCGLDATCAGGGIDRIDSKSGYSKSNTQACCKYCNVAKLDYWSDDIMKEIIGPSIRQARMRTNR